VGTPAKSKHKICPSWQTNKITRQTPRTTQNITRLGHKAPILSFWQEKLHTQIHLWIFSFFCKGAKRPPSFCHDKKTLTCKYDLKTRLFGYSHSFSHLFWIPVKHPKIQTVIHWGVAGKFEPSKCLVQVCEKLPFFLNRRSLNFFRRTSKELQRNFKGTSSEKLDLSWHY